ncbi:MAG: hypothetical protein A3H39_07745 [candidate division NC10 bacterium RIFCSPLOWO2_02_FULL_66_22]|nr:MAG: hypothetical protein A3H39_07745 [candidate division NC10 bacterium RIFCSPLOWO2_02_FULL_66_22]
MDAPGGSGEGPVARRGIRTGVLSAVALVGLAAIAVAVLYTSLNPPQEMAPPTGPATEASRPETAPPDAEGPAIAGTVTIAPELRARLTEEATLFIIARKGPGPPFAVKRIARPSFPLPYRMGPRDMMMAGTPFEGEVSVSARLSRAGAAGPAQPGDLEGEHPDRVAVGARGADIVISRAR